MDAFPSAPEADTIAYEMSEGESSVVNRTRNEVSALVVVVVEEEEGGYSSWAAVGFDMGDLLVPVGGTK